MYVGTVEYLDSLIEQQVGDLDEFESSCIFFDSHDVEFVSVGSVTSVNFRFPLKLYLIDCISSGLGTIDPSSVSYAFNMPLVEDRKVVNVSTKVTCTISLLLNYDLDTVVSW